jgi:hypothetical protein
MINRAKLRVILREEAERIFHEAEAHEDDLIHQAYLGLDVSSGPALTDSDDDSDAENDEAQEDSEQVDDGSAEPAEPIDISEEDVNQVKKSLLRRFNDSKVVDFGLDLLGTFGGYLAAGASVGSMGLGAPPAYVLAAVPDLINSVRHAARGKNLDAAIYFLCALPVIGEVLGPVKISMKLLGTAARAADVFDLIDQVRKLIKGLKAVKGVKNASSKIKEICEKYFPDFDADSIEQDAFIILEGSDDEVDDLLRRNGYIDDENDDDVSTEASPKFESKKERLISVIFESPKASSKKNVSLPIEDGDR